MKNYIKGSQHMKVESHFLQGQGYCEELQSVSLELRTKAFLNAI